LGVPWIIDFDKRPASEAAMVIDGGYPECTGSGNLGGLVFFLVQAIGTK
jgi:hypothetical protein